MNKELNDRTAGLSNRAARLPQRLSWGILSIAFAFALCGNAYGQNRDDSELVVSGTVTDAAEGDPLPGANILLQGLSVGATTDAEGRYELAVPDPNATLKFSFVGFETRTVPVERRSVIDVQLTPSLTMGEEVVVEGQRAARSVGAEKKSFDLSENLSQSGGTLLGAMKNLPGVTIDREGKVLLRGSDQVTILIDGKQSSLTGFGSQEGLDNLSASAVERIEIINNPSAKYGAKGQAGIINIILKKEDNSGFNGDLALNAGVGELTDRRESLLGVQDKFSSTPKLNPSVSLNYRANDVNWFIQADGTFRRRVNSNEFTTTLYSDNTSDVTTQFLENRSQQQYNIKGGVDWYLDDANTFTVSVLFEDEYHIDSGDVPYYNSGTDDLKRMWEWEEDERTYFLNYAANYEHNFSEPGHALEAGLRYTSGKENEVFPFTDSSAVRNSFDRTHLVSKENVTTGNVDYVKPLGRGRLEAGLKMQLRNIPISYTITTGANSILDPNLGDWSKYQEDIYAAYTNYVFEGERYEVEAGARLEETVIDYAIDPENAYYTRNESYNYLSLYPNVRLTYKLNDYNKISAFYNRRVDRPGEFELRPFPKYDDPEILKTGNPYLRPQFTQSFELAYENFWEQGSIYGAVYYKRIQDIFSRIYTSDATPSSIRINATPHNLGRGSNLGFEVSFEQSMSSFYSLSGSFNGYRNVINAFEGTSLYPSRQDFTFEEAETTTWNASLNNDINLPARTDLQVTGVYYAPNIIPQGKIEQRWSVDVGLQKRFGDGRTEVTLAATDLFNTFDIRREVTGENFSLVSQNYYETQVVRLGVRYKF